MAGDAPMVVVGVIGFFVLFFGVAVAQYQQRANLRRKEQYLAVPGALDARGEQQCFKCRNKGIYKKGQYKDDTITYCHCSKCKEFLYVEIEPGFFDKLLKP